MANEETYARMLENLKGLLAGLEHDAVTVDELSTKLDEAYLLLEKLKHRLTETEARVVEVVNARGRSATGVTALEAGTTGIPASPCDE